GLTFTHDLDAILPGLVATDTPLTDPCGAGSSLTGTSSLAFTGGSLAANESCQFSVTVQLPASASAGTYPASTSDLLAEGYPVASPASTGLQVEPAPVFSKAFSPDTIVDGDVTSLVFTIDNTASALAATALAFNDFLPAGVVVASPANLVNSFGGIATAVSGSGTISMTGGTIGAGASGTLSVDVTSSTPGDHVNTTGDLTSSGGNSGPASDTLIVNAAADLTITISRDRDPVRAGRTLTYIVTVTNRGPSTAENVVVSTGLLPSLSLIATMGTAEDPLGVPTASLGSIPTGGSVQFTIKVLVDRNQFAPFEFGASVTSSTLARDGSTISESTSLTVLAQLFRPDLLVGASPTNLRGDNRYPVSPTYSAKTKRATASISVAVENDGNVDDAIRTRIIGRFKPRELKVFSGAGSNLTGTVIRGGAVEGLTSGGRAVYRIVLEGRDPRRTRAMNAVIHAASESDPVQSDRAKIRIRFEVRPRQTGGSTREEHFQQIIRNQP
ncbi:MAG: DUF11 domain-containing protein, partial [Verrucomicrobiae bacterium]|nr:DUF11 domain-containing protein [Verrucomicrobiae bacterium]